MLRLSALTVLAAIAVLPLQLKADPVIKTTNLRPQLTELSDTESTTAFLDLDGGDGFAYLGSQGSPLANDIVEYAGTLRGTPYVWGATGPKSFDCSGFVGYVYRKFNISLPRVSAAQATQGVKVSKDELLPGDLLFFSRPRNTNGGVGHVGMVVSVDDATGDVKFIHASTKRGVVYESLSKPAYTRRFITARRILQ